MKSHADIPPTVLDFVLKRIDTVTELEALLIMSAEEQREWSVDEISARIYVPSPSAAAVLHALKERRLISADEAGLRFRFSPADAQERQAVLQTAVAYRKHLVPITKLIHQKIPGPVQEFARAFSLKKDD